MVGQILSRRRVDHLLAASVALSVVVLATGCASVPGVGSLPSPTAAPSPTAQPSLPPHATPTAQPSPTAESSPTANPSPTAASSPADSATPTVDPSGTENDSVSGDLGIGETLLIVVGAAHEARAEAQAGAHSFGDMQGFYVDVTDNYRLLDVCDDSGGGPALAAGQLVAGQWLQLSAFRTWHGALEFMDLVETSEGHGFGAYASASIYLVEKTGGPYVGLGQEADPDGSGPLPEPLDEPPSCP